MTTFSQAKTALDEIAQRIGQDRKRLAAARDTVAAAEADLAAMPAAYGQTVTDIGTKATNAPGDTAWAVAKAESDHLVAEFNALQATAAAMKAALDAIQ